MRPTRFDYAADVTPLAELGAVHILAAGGAGMSAIVRLCLDAGLPVSGSDAKDSPLLAALRARGARIDVGHDPRHVAGADTVVVSSAIRDDNVELVAGRAAGARILHRAQALASLMAGRRVAAVAGANGKTTTTAMLTTVLEHAGADPSFAIGGELAEVGANARLGSGEAFVVEADESDGSFLAYRPDVAVVTNVQPDHLDFYGTAEAVAQAYAEFAASMRPGGLLVACADDPGSAALAADRRLAGASVRTYGFSPAADLVLRAPAFAGATGSARFAEAAHPGLERELRVPLPGEHNLLNAAGAYLAATAGLGVDPPEALAALAAFGGTRRRFELKGEAGGVRVVDDYAHNAPKVAAVVAAGRQVAPPGRLVVCFQPHLYSRTRDFADAFGAALAGADAVVVLDVYGAREEPMPGITSRLVSDAARSHGAPTVVDVVGHDAAVAALRRLVAPGDLVLVVGAGDVTAVGPRLLAELAAGPPGRGDAGGDGPLTPGGAGPR